LSNGTLVMVVRLDGGDGLETHPFLNYYRTVSHDDGLAPLLDQKQWLAVHSSPASWATR
jgi:hypothetical protein